MANAGIAADDPQVGDGFASARHHRHARAFERMPADGALQPPAAYRLAEDDRLVFPLYRTLGDELDQSLMRWKILGHQHQPRGVLIQPVHNAAARNFGQIGAMVQQGVDQGPGRISGSGVDHQAGRLIHHHQGLVLVDDVDIHRLRDPACVRLRVDLDLHPLAAVNEVFLPASPAVQYRVSGSNPLLDPVARVLREELRQGLVHARACERLGNDSGQVSLITHDGSLPRAGFWINLAPMKAMTLIRDAIGLVLALTLVAGCASWGKEQDKTRDWSAERLYQEAKLNMDIGDYETAIDYYQKLESRFPFGMLAQQAQLDIAYAYYKFDEPASAIAAADRFIKLHPRHPNVDYAYYLKGLVHFSQGRTFFDRFFPRDMSRRDPGAARDSFEAFSELVRRFPNSKYAEDASQRMVYLKNMLAQHEIHIANYYMRRGAYVAAANRARYVVENFQRTPAIPDALAVMAKAYTVMGLDELASDSVRVLRLNYPDYEGLSEIDSLKAN